MSALIRVVLSAQSARVLPGEKTEISATIQNFSEIVDRYQINVEGIDPSWVTVSRKELSLFPKDQDQVRITLQPPAGTEARAGSYDMRVLAISQENPVERTTVPFVLEIGAQATLDVTLRPQKQSSLDQGVFSLQVANSGNTDLTVQLSASDPEEGCYYAFTPPQVPVPAGQSRMIQLLVRPKAPPPGKMTKSYAFTVTARPAENPKLARQVPGQFEHLVRQRRSAWPVVVVALVVVAALAAVALAVVLPRLKKGKAEPTSPAVLPTPDLVDTAMAQAAATQTALAQAAQATAQAAQATANAMATAGAQFADYVAVWAGTYACSGVTRAQFQITNTGTLPFESMDIRVVLLPGGDLVNGYQTNTPFVFAPSPPTPDCLAPGQARLDPGGRAWHGIEIASMTLGSSGRAYITLCTQDNLGGDCVQKSVDFALLVRLRPLEPLHPLLPTMQIIPVRPIIPIPLVPTP